jgi:hypothetical protein
MQNKKESEAVMRKFISALVALTAFLMMAKPVYAVTNFPGAVDATVLFGTAVFGQPVKKETINNLRDAVIALETKVGVNSSIVTTTLDYLLKSAASVNPGHLHTGASLSAIDASTITIGTLGDARLSANIARLNGTNTWSATQTFSAGINVTGTATATLFSGSGASLTSIPETAITNGALLARVGDTETVNGSWTFNSPPFASGTNFSNIPEGAILDGTFLARVAANESIAGTWSFVGNIAKIRNVSLLWPASNSAGTLTNDGSGNLSWAAAGGAGFFQGGNSFTAPAVLGTNDAFDLVFERSNVSIATIQAAGFNPFTDNTFALGTSALRWSSLHLGPSSLVIHNDATNTDKTTFAYSGGLVLWNATAGTPLKMSASAVAGTSPLQFTADTTSGTASTKQFFFQMANTGAPNVNPLRGVYIAEPANAFTGAQSNLFVEDATKASGVKYSAEFAGTTSVYKNFEIGDANVGGARLAIDNGAGSHGAAGTIIEKLKQHASQSGNVFQVQTSSDNVQWAIGANGFTVMGGVNATIGTDRLRLIGSTADSTANALLVQSSAASGSLFTVRNDGQSLFGGTVIAGTDNSFDIGNSTTGSFRTAYFDTSVVSPLFTFGGALSVTTTASNGDITLDADGTGNIIASDLFRPSGDNTIDLGSSSFSWKTLYADTSVLTPLVSFGGALSITTTSAGSITITPNSGSSVLLGASAGNNQAALCIADASGTIGHCTSTVGAGGLCTCVAN